MRTEGSLSKAASHLGMSYNKAWRTLHAAEQRLGFALLERRIGGEHGGGSQVSPPGEELLRRYVALRADVERDLETLYDKHFSDWPAGPSAGDAPRRRWPRPRGGPLTKPASAALAPPARNGYNLKQTAKQAGVPARRGASM